LAGLLAALRHNEGHRNGELLLFELGRVFAVGEDETPLEHEELGVLLARPHDDARAAVGLFGLLAEGLGVAKNAYVLDQQTTDHPVLAGLHPARRALLRDRRGNPRTRAVIGAVGEVDSAALVALGLADRRIGWVSLDLEAFFALRRRSPLARPVSRFPSADLDFAFVLDEKVPATDLEETLRRGAGDLVESVELLDVYRGTGIAPGTRSLAYRVRFGALDHTLAVEELAAARAAAIAFVESHLPAKLRA
jgi:phenylalanyl-tRNA synthetase beta chain